MGIEVLNKPSFPIENLNRTRLLSYYESSYRILRTYSHTGIFIFNDIYSKSYSFWNLALKEPEFYNVALDLHLYDWQEPYTFSSAEQHISDAIAWEHIIAEISKTHPVYIGEWSYSTGEYCMTNCWHV